MFYRLLILVVLTPAAVLAAPPVYQPLGAPADPAVAARWNFYRDYAEATGLLKQIAAAHPKLCRLESLGKSYGGREMWLLTITNQANEDPERPQARPAMWIDGGIHANELQAVDTVLYTAWYLTESYGRNKLITKLLDERAFYLMPMMSPDARDAHFYDPNTTNGPRSGLRPVDDDQDGRIDEDPPEDIDGDGHIVEMRVRDPQGRWKSHPKYPELMIRAKPDEAGEFRLLGPEGFDNDGDGEWFEDGPGYYDPNRDWAWQWQPGFVQNGAYRYPFSIEENRLVADFVIAHPNIAGAQSYHNTGGMILRGPGAKRDVWPQEDIAVFDRLAERGVEMLPGYRYLNTAEGLYEVFGGESDWFYGMRGVFAFTNELNTPFNFFREHPEGRNWFGTDEERRKFDDLLLQGEGYVPWHEVEHPQFGKVEVGGQKKSWGRQPPSFLLEEECHRNMAFTLWHADQMPQARVASVEVKKLEGGLHQVTAVFLNEKATPTRSAHNVAHAITRSDLARIFGDELKVVAALVSDEPFFIQPRDVEHNPAEVELSTLKSRTPVYVRWLVEGGEEFTVEIDTIQGGIDRKVSPQKDAK
jgi:hypothetical protein